MSGPRSILKKGPKKGRTINKTKKTRPSYITSNGRVGRITVINRKEVDPTTLTYPVSKLGELYKTPTKVNMFNHYKKFYNNQLRTGKINPRARNASVRKIKKWMKRNHYNHKMTRRKLNNMQEPNQLPESYQSRSANAAAIAQGRLMRQATADSIRRNVEAENAAAVAAAPVALPPFSHVPQAAAFAAPFSYVPQAAGPFSYVPQAAAPFSYVPQAAAFASPAFSPGIYSHVPGALAPGIYSHVPGALAPGIYSPVPRGNYGAPKKR